MTDIVTNLVNDSSDSFKGKKLLAESEESYSFTDIDNMIKQTYASSNEHHESNKTLQKFFTQWQIFFHGNTHITNWNFMLNSLQNKNPESPGYESCKQLLSSKPKSFRQYYTQKAEKFKQDVDDKLATEERDDLRYPLVQKYWDISLD